MDTNKLVIADPHTYAISMAKKDISDFKEPSIKTEFEQLKASGMFWEFYPELTGEWEKDKKEFARQLKKLRK